MRINRIDLLKIYSSFNISVKAGPVFRYLENKLKGTDAKKVLVIHTSEIYGISKCFNESLTTLVRCIYS